MKWRIKKYALVAVVVLICLMLVVSMQDHIDDEQRESLEDELLYYPSENLLGHFTAGMSSVIADLMWLKTIQYTAKEFHNPERKFAWLEHMVNLVVKLDPHFVDAYVYGGMFMSAIADDEKALTLLKRGFIANPESYELPLEIAKVYLLNRRERPESPAIVARYLLMVAERHKTPELYLTWARRIQEENDLAGGARAIWEDMLANSDDALVRELAEANLLLLVAGDNAEFLQEKADDFMRLVGRSPADLKELVQAGLTPALPADPREGVYYLDAEGRVQNTLLLEDVVVRTLKGMNTHVRSVALERGHAPRSFDEWMEWYEFELPQHPISGGVWEFNPETGYVE